MHERRERGEALEHGLAGREESIYRVRFSARQQQIRERVWGVLCRDFFQRFLSGANVVVDLGAGDGLFVRNIVAPRRIAVDISPRARVLEPEGIEVVLAPASDFAGALPRPADVIFMSNLLEHLPDRRHVLDVLDECRRALVPGGLLLVLQPNIRHVGHAYWDFIDHQVALTDRSLAEALRVCGFEIVELLPRFLPYTADSGLVTRLGPDLAPVATRLYLRWPLLWRIFGAQTFAAARVAPVDTRS